MKVLIFLPIKIGSVYFAVNGITACRSILPQLRNPMPHKYHILFYATVFMNLMVNRRSHNSKPKPPKRNEPKPRQESNPKQVQRFLSYAALYPLSYREVVAIEHKTAFKNPRPHSRQNRFKSYFIVNGKIEVARGFATWKIRHRRFATKKIRHTTGETYECDREFEHKRPTNVCNSTDVEDSPRNGDRLGVG